MTPDNPERGQYTQIMCPMPVGGDPREKCGADLYWTWDVVAPVYLGDLLADSSLMAPPGPGEAQSGEWKVACVEGHVVMLPAPIDVDEPVDGDHEDLRVVRREDLSRLRGLVGVLGPCVDLGGVPQIVSAPAAADTDDVEDQIVRALKAAAPSAHPAAITTAARFVIAAVQGKGTP